MSDTGRGFVTDLVLVLTAMTLGVGMIGILGRWFLLPWLRTHLVAPIQETARQVKINGHTSSPPTLLDTVHTLRDDVEGVHEQVSEARAAFQVAARMFEGHIIASDLDRGALWAAVRRLEASHTAAVEQMAERLERHLDAITESHLR